MKRTASENIIVSNAIGKALGITFTNEEFPLGKWGEVDNWCELGYNKLLLLECENTQKHPCTNVLKLFPYLEEYPNVHVVLIHYYFSSNKAPKNRVALGSFIGEKMEGTFGIRFQYVPLQCSLASISKELHKHNSGILQILLKGR